jgi:hypothetical protein
MVETMQHKLPDWTTTLRPGATVDVSDLCSAAAEFVRKAPAERDAWVRDFAERFCMPNLAIPEASGLYLLLRAAFVLPESHPRAATKVFGGWLHPSIKASGNFDLAWPVHMRGNRIVVERFRGYAMGPYDALAEYRYFAQSFTLRSLQELQRLEGGGTTVA